MRTPSERQSNARASEQGTFFPLICHRKRNASPGGGGWGTPPPWPPTNQRGPLTFFQKFGVFGNLENFGKEKKSQHKKNLYGFPWPHFQCVAGRFRFAARARLRAFASPPSRPAAFIFSGSLCFDSLVPIRPRREELSRRIMESGIT